MLRWIDGSATLTTVLSSMTMNSAKHIAASVHQRRLSSVTARRRSMAKRVARGATRPERSGRAVELDRVLVAQRLAAVAPGVLLLRDLARAADLVAPGVLRRAQLDRRPLGRDGRAIQALGAEDRAQRAVGGLAVGAEDVERDGAPR